MLGLGVPTSLLLAILVLALANSSRSVWGISGSNRMPCGRGEGSRGRRAPGERRGTPNPSSAAWGWVPVAPGLTAHCGARRPTLPPLPLVPTERALWGKKKKKKTIPSIPAGRRGCRDLIRLAASAARPRGSHSCGVLGISTILGSRRPAQPRSAPGAPARPATCRVQREDGEQPALPRRSAPVPGAPQPHRRPPGTRPPALTFSAFLAASASERLSKLTNPTGCGGERRRGGEGCPKALLFFHGDPPPPHPELWGRAPQPPTCFEVSFMSEPS